jgi:hypothetical protein
MNAKTRESREGWPLLTVETEAMGTLGVHMKGVLPWFVRWARRAGAIDFCVSAEQNIIFLSTHFFTLLVPIA